MEITVGNMRKAPRRGYVEVRVDRASVLGNPFAMRNEADRDKVIAQYRRWLWGRLQTDTPQKRKLNRIADMAVRGQQIELRCWCAPKKCHAEVIKAAVEWIIRGRLRLAREMAS